MKRWITLVPAFAALPLAFTTGYLYRENRSDFPKTLTSPSSSVQTELSISEPLPSSAPSHTFLQSAWAGGVPIPELPNLVSKILPGVVNISSTTVIRERIYGWNDWLDFWGIPRNRKQSSLGSGFIIDTHGHVLTNHHVIDQASEIMVTLHNKKTYQAKVVGKDPKTDLALLLLRDEEGRSPKGLTPLTLANSDSVRIAEPVFAVGNPFGLQHTVTMGIISAKNRTIGLGPFDNFLQTDASINPGNSGGPLFNLKGQVIGINTVIYSRSGQSGGLGFAIPATEAQKIVPSLKRYGRVPRPWLGVLGEAITPSIQRYYRLSSSKGVLIYNLVQNAPAHKEGLRQGDIILSVNGETTEEPMDIERVLGKLKPDQSADLEVLRGQRQFKVKIPLEELPPRLDQLPAGII